MASSKLSLAFRITQDNQRALAGPALEEASTPAPAEEAGGAGAVEVAAMLGDSVVGVSHCMDPRGGKPTRATWAIAAGGLACLLASASAFYVSVDTAASNKARLEHHTRELKKPAYSFRPRELGGLAGGVALGGLALGLSALTLALVRARGERRSPFYRIGTAPGVEQPLAGAPSERFPLVAPSGDGFVFSYGPGIEGELIAGGMSTPLSELAATGRARLSSTTPGAIELPIPAAARIRARAGRMTFLVSAVARPKQQALSALALDGRAMKYVAGSLSMHLAIVLLLSQVAIPEAGAVVDLTSREDRPISARIPAAEQAPPEPEPGDTDPGSVSEPGGKPEMGLSGAAGNPENPKPDRTAHGQNNSATPRPSRAQDLEAAREEARTAGILGSTLLRDGFSKLASDLPLGSGFDGNGVWDPLGGAGGPGSGRFGGGPSGSGCFMPPCGIITGGPGYGDLIGKRPGGGDGDWPFTRRPPGLGPRRPLVPIPAPRVVEGGTIDKSIIKRRISQHQQQISHCYEKELLARPNLAGTVEIQFLISPSGNVQDSGGNGFDPTVTSCVANVIRNISFPASRDGSPVSVTYPFTFRLAGHS